MKDNRTTNDKSDLQNETYQQDISYAANVGTHEAGQETSQNNVFSKTVPCQTTETIQRYNHTLPLIKESPDEILHQTIYADKVIEVPQTITILKPVYKKEIRELIREVPKIIERTIDRVVEVPDNKNVYPYFNNALQSYKTPIPAKTGTDVSRNIPCSSNIGTYTTALQECNVGTYPCCYVSSPSQPLMNEFHTTHSLPIPYGTSYLEKPSSVYQPPLYCTCVPHQHTPILSDPIYPECAKVTNMLPQCSGTSTFLPYYTPSYPSVSSYSTLVYPGVQPSMMAMPPSPPCTLIRAPSLALPMGIQQPMHPHCGFPYSSSKQLTNDTNAATSYKPKKPSMCCFTKPFLQRQNYKKTNKDNKFFVLKSNPLNTPLQLNRLADNPHTKTTTYAYPYMLQGTTIYSTPVTAPFPFPM